MNVFWSPLPLHWGVFCSWYNSLNWCGFTFRRPFIFGFVVVAVLDHWRFEKREKWKKLPICKCRRCGVYLLVQSFVILPDTWFSFHFFCISNVFSKVDKLIQNALACHAPAALAASTAAASGGVSLSSSFAASISEGGPLAHAIVRFQHTDLKHKEPAGGILYTWRKYKNRTLFTEEGIWLFPRLIAANIAQWFVVVMRLAAFAYGLIRLGAEEEVFEGISNAE